MIKTQKKNGKKIVNLNSFQMDYKEALRIKNLNDHLIGRLYKGAKIDEVIIYPNNKAVLDSFIKLYLETNDSAKALSPFMQQRDFHIAVICDKNKILTSGWFTPIDLEYISDAKW